MTEKIKFGYGAGGALVCDVPIEGVTQGLDYDAEKYYGGRFFIGESMTKGAAEKLAELLGGEFVDVK